LTKFKQIMTDMTYSSQCCRCLPHCYPRLTVYAPCDDRFAGGFVSMVIALNHNGTAGKCLFTHSYRLSI